MCWALEPTGWAQKILKCPKIFPNSVHREVLKIAVYGRQWPNLQCLRRVYFRVRHGTLVKYMYTVSLRRAAGAFFFENRAPLEVIFQ